MNEVASGDDVYLDQDELQESAAKKIALIDDVIIDQDESQLVAKEVALRDDVFCDQVHLRLRGGDGAGGH